MLKTSDKSNLTPIEKQIQGIQDFAKNMAVSSAIQSLVDRLIEAETALEIFETNEFLKKENSLIIPVIKKEIEEIEQTFVDLAEISESHGISA